MSVHVHNRMNLEGLTNYFKESFSKNVAKSINVVDARNICESLQYLAKQQKQSKQHSFKINKEDQHKKLLILEGTLTDYKQILSQMQNGKTMTRQWVKNYKMGGLMDFYDRNLDKLFQISQKMTQKTKKQYYFWEIAAICVDQTLQKLKEGSQKSKIKQPSKLTQPNKFLNQMSREQSIGIKNIQQQLIYGGETEEYKNTMKIIATKHNLPTNVLEVVQKQYGIWYKVLNNLYPIFYETTPKYQDIQGNTLAEKCYWISTQLATKIQDKHKKVSQSLGLEQSNSTNLSSLFELLVKQNKNIQKQFGKIFNDFQNNKTLQSPQKSQKTTYLDKQKKINADMFLIGVPQKQKRVTGVKKQQQKDIKQKHEVKMELQKRIKYYVQKIQNDKEQKKKLDQQIIKLNGKIQNLEQNLNQKNNKINKLEEQIQRTNKQNKQNEQKIKNLKASQRKLIQKYKQTQQFLEKCQNLLQIKQKMTWVKLYEQMQQNNNKIERIFDILYEKTKDQNQMQYLVNEPDSLAEKQKFIKQFLKNDKLLIKSRKFSNNQSDQFQILDQKELLKQNNKDFRKQSSEQITQSQKVKRISMSGIINKSEYSEEQEKQHNKSNSELQKIKQENSKLTKDIKDLKQQLSQKNSQIQRINNDLKKKQNKNSQLQKHSPKYLRHTLFYSGMFNQLLKEQFVIDSLYTYLKNNQITNFNLLHRSIDPTDLITDIEKHPNILLIGLTKSGHSIAAYSSLSVCNTLNTKQPKGLIMLTKSQICHSLKPKQKSLEKENKFLTFSIGDIRLKISVAKEEQPSIYFQTDNKQLMQKQRDDSHKQIRNSPSQTRIQLVAYQIYEIKFNENNIIEQKKGLQTLQVKSSIFQQDRSRSSVIDEMKSANKKTPTQQIRQLKQKVERYEKSIKTLKQQNDELKGLGGSISQSYSNKRNPNVRQQSKGKYNFIQSSSLNKKAANLTLNSEKSQRSTQRPIDKKQEQLNMLNQKYKEQAQALKSLQIKLKAEQAKNKRLQSEKEQLLQKIKKKQKQIQELKNKKPDNSISTQLQSKQKQILNLTKEKNEYESKLKQIQEENKRNKQQTQKKVQELLQIQQLLKQEKQKSSTAKEQLGHKINQLTKKKKQYDDTIASLQNKNKLMSKQIEQYKKTKEDNVKHEQNRQRKQVNNIQQAELKQKLQKLSMQNKEKQQEIKKLQKQISSLKVTSDNLKNQILQKQKKVEFLIRQQKLKQTRVKFLQSQANQVNQKMISLKKQSVLLKMNSPQIKSAPKEKQQSKGQLQKQKQILQRILKQRQEIQGQIANKQKFLREMGEKQKKLSANIKLLEQKSSKMGEQFQKAQKVVQNMDKLQQERIQLQANISKLQDNISKLQDQQKSKQDKLKQYQYRINLIKKQLSEQISQKAKLQTLKKSIKQKQFQIVQKNNVIASIQNKIKQAGKILSQTESESSLKEKSQNDKLNQIEDQIKFNQAKLKSLQTKILSKIQGDQNVAGFHQFFVGEIVDNNPDRHYIISQIQKVMCRQIKKTKLLYVYPLMNILNPHIPVDGVPNYIVLIKMRQRNKEGKKFTIAMFSEKALEKSNVTNNKRGFICSVTNRQVFYLVKSPTNNPRVTQYNQFYIVFGNNEIIFRINSPLLQSKIGHNFKSFDTGTMKTGEVFTGSCDQKSEMEGYQIYQVMF